MQWNFHFKCKHNRSLHCLIANPLSWILHLSLQSLLQEGGQVFRNLHGLHSNINGGNAFWSAWLAREDVFTHSLFQSLVILRLQEEVGHHSRVCSLLLGNFSLQLCVRSNGPEHL